MPLEYLREVGAIPPAAEVLDDGLARECPRRTGAGARSLTSKFRPFLRYLYVEGLVAMPLVRAWSAP